MNEQIRELVASASGDESIRRAAASDGTRSLTSEGRALVEQGLTSLDEVLRVTGGVEEDSV